MNLKLFEILILLQISLAFSKISSIKTTYYKSIDIFTDDIKTEINEYNVISFDIFDTLLIRPYVKNTDIFEHLEKLNNATGFVKARMKADKECRSKGVSTFDGIYEFIDQKYKWLKEKELLLEYNSIKARSLVKGIYEYAINQNKTVIMISDMYYSKEILIDMLKKCGYTNVDKLYISSEHSKNKLLKSVYKIIMKNLGIYSKDILHIGNYLESDIKKTRKLGINSFYIPKVIDILFDIDPRTKIFYNNYNNDIGVSILLGLLASHTEQSYKNYWHEFGYKYAGPIIFGYMQWLNEQLLRDEIKKVLFIARDGYTLEKVFNLINTSESKVYYFYFPRRIAYKFIFKNQDNEKKIKDYLPYLDKFDLSDKKIALVDSVSTFFSSQKGLVKMLSEKYIKGYYWYTPKSEYKNLIFDSYQKNYTNGIGKGSFGLSDGDILELIMTAPTPPIKKFLNGEPVFEDENEFEDIRIKLYFDLSSGAVEFAKDYINHFGKISGYFSCRMLIDWMNTFLNFPTETDKSKFFNIEHTRNSHHDHYFKLFYKWY